MINYRVIRIYDNYRMVTIEGQKYIQFTKVLGATVRQKANYVRSVLERHADELLR